MRKIDFKKGAWKPEDFRYVYSPRFAPIPRIRQEQDCIVFGIDEKGEFDYVSMLLEQKCQTGAKAVTTCSFEAYGAPLIVLTDDLRKKENGEWYYGVHYEIVLWEDGINVWKLNLNDGIMNWQKLMALEFKVSAYEPHELGVKVLDDMLEIEVEGHKAQLRVEGLPKEFYIGFTACEGINRFYDFSIEA